MKWRRNGEARSVLVKWTVLVRLVEDPSRTGHFLHP